jgi:hypothetical protein
MGRGLRGADSIHNLIPCCLLSLSLSLPSPPAVTMHFWWMTNYAPFIVMFDVKLAFELYFAMSICFNLFLQRPLSRLLFFFKFFADMNMLYYLSRTGNRLLEYGPTRHG